MTAEPKGINLNPPMNLYVTSEPQFFRVLFVQDFHVHRTKPTPEDLKVRHDKARKICPYWFKEPNTIVALTQKRHPRTVQTTATFETGPKYDLIHEWEATYTKPEDRPSWHESVKTHGYYKEPCLAYDYQDKYPTAQYGLALRNIRRPRHKTRS